MYKSYFNLKENPFNMTPDPRYLYLSEQHEDALMQLLYGINSKKGFLMVTGEVGTGKTTICRTLLERLADDTETSLILNPYLNDAELLRSVIDDFGVSCSSDSIKDMIDTLNTFLLKMKNEEKNSVLIIDEAQNLPIKSMELIRMLSNLETNTEKLLQIVLIGQPELKEKLKSNNLRQLNQRITIRANLKPLDINETKGYIVHRLVKAGAPNGNIFTSSAAKEVYKITNGYPRLINSLCDRALLCTYSVEKRNIDKEIIKRAAIDVFETAKPKQSLNYYKYAFALTLLLLVVLIAFLFKKTKITKHSVEQVNVIERMPAQEKVKEAKQKTVATTTQPQPKAVEPKKEMVARKNEKIYKDSSGWFRSEHGFAFEVSMMNLLNIWGEDAETLDTIKMVSPPALDLKSMLMNFNKYGIYLKKRYDILNAKFIFKRLKDISLPAIVILKGNNSAFSLLTSFSDGEVEYIDSKKGVITLSDAEFKKIYSGEAILIYKSPFVSNKLLKSDVETEDVVILEESLQKLGYFSKKPDNKFDLSTQNAVLKFQKKYGLKTDGCVGYTTKLVLIKELNKDILQSGLR